MHINIFDGNVITYMYIICIFSFGMQSFFLKMWQVNSAVYMAGNESNYRGGSRSLHFTCINVQYIHDNNKVEVKSESSGHFRTSSTQSRAHKLKSFIVLLHVLKASGSSWKTKSGDFFYKKKCGLALDPLYSSGKYHPNKCNGLPFASFPTEWIQLHMKLNLLTSYSFDR